MQKLVQNTYLNIVEKYKWQSQMKYELSGHVIFR